MWMSHGMFSYIYMHIYIYIYVVSEQLNFPGWGCQPHAQSPAILEDRCFRMMMMMMMKYVVTNNVTLHLYLWHDFYNMVFKIRVSSPPSLIKIFLCAPGPIYVTGCRRISYSWNILGSWRGRFLKIPGLTYFCGSKL
jgi:hypothetical protein